MFWRLYVKIATASVLLVSGKEFFANVQYKDDEYLILKKRTVIITGANSGLGKSVAEHFASKKACVIMACRNMDACRNIRNGLLERTKHKDIYCWECDLASQDSIRQFSESVIKLCPTVDYLINNAGVMHCPRSKTKEGIEMHLGVNYMGHFLLTNLLLDKLKESSGSRILNVVNTSFKDAKIDFEDLNSVENYDSVKSFNQSQLAIMQFTRELSNRLTGTAVKVNAVYPGPTWTNIDRHTLFKNSVLHMFECVWKYLTRFTVNNGAKSINSAALSPESLEYNGVMFNITRPEPIDVYNFEVSNRLWNTASWWTELSSK